MGQLQLLSKSDYKKLLVATEVYRQQLSMYEKKEQSIQDSLGKFNTTTYSPHRQRKSREIGGIWGKTVSEWS